MRKINSRSFMILLMTLAFFAGLTYHTVNLVLHASQWVAEPTNSHLTDVDGLEFAGKIFDRNRILKQPEYEHSGRSSIHSYYVLSVDVGRKGCDSVICVWKVTP